MRIDGRWFLLLVVLLASCSRSDAGNEPAATAAADSGVAPASAPSPPASLAPAPPATAGYQLNIADLEKWVTATANIRSAAQADPGLASVLRAMPEPRTLQQLEAAYAGLPPARQAIEAAGLSVHEFATIGFAYAQAAVAAGAVQSGASRDSVAAAAGVGAGNLDFVLDNEAALARVFQPLQGGRR